MVQRGRKVTADDVATVKAGGGLYDAADDNIAAIASELKASPAEVRRVMSAAAQERAAAMFSGIAGRKAPDETSPRSMLQAVFGQGPRGGAVNAAAAAKAFKVTANTVRRWAAGTQKPSAQRMKKLKNAARRLTRTKAGRRKSTDACRARRGRRPGADTVWVTGWQGPADEYASERYRTVKMDVTPDDVDALLDRYEEDGDAGLHDWLTNHYRTNDWGGVDGWVFHSIDAFGFGDPNYD
ncbi:MAG: hypothetical protein O3B27_06080 [Actinomycetota bacterium]|nr:hypothetical protein [Actinomycetota bacterium]MDA2950395.1 hypothetical protein [Actinomycetota bacterium]MDA2991109.1 hypothetical protein [Actinomycetota bacterium]